MIKKTSMNIDADLWQRFKVKCAQEGKYPCRVLETLILAWVEGEPLPSTSEAKGASANSGAIQTKAESA